jgi:cyclophilin family peptidyl-prolyl cis-trans isomerase
MQWGSCGPWVLSSPDPTRLANRRRLAHPIEIMRNSSAFPRFFPACRVGMGLLLMVGSFSLGACGGDAAENAGETATNPLLQPRDFTERSPDLFIARLETTKGVVRIQVTREWAPLGADRFFNLVKAGYYDGVTFHRVIEGFMAEFGINGDPWVNAAWRQATMQDEPVRKPNNRGRVSFSKNEPNTRTVQLFINTKDNASLNGQGFSPFGEVVEGMEVVDALYSEYGESPTRGGEGVYQAMAIAKGDEYLDLEFPLLDRIERAIVEEVSG